MTDLTVLISPLPLYPAMKPTFTFGRRASQPASRPIMVTLETEREPDGEEGTAGNEDESLSSSPPKRSRSPMRYDSKLLSPPPHTWKSRTRSRHRPSRSQSAPPERRLRKEEEIVEDAAEERPIELAPLDFVRPQPQRSLTAFPSLPTTRGGELIRPPPPLLRPTTFWRKTRKSGVSGPSYSPSSHLIRRSTFIAAGLTFDSPVHDLSALGVESRVGFIVVPPEQTLLVACVLAGACVSPATSNEVKADGVQHINSRRQVVIPPQPTISASPSAPPVVVSPVPAPVNTPTPAPTPPSLPSVPPVVEITIVITTPSAKTTTSSPSTRVSSISASPSSNTSANTSQLAGSGAQSQSQRQFNLLYLVPVFVVLGILWGALAAWLTYKCLMRRCKAQDNLLIGGPRYVSAARDLEGGKSPQQIEMQAVAFSWPDLKQAGKESERDEENEDDPFLLPPSPTAQRAGRTKSAQSAMTARSDATYALETDDESKREDVPWESLRHKSIKRGILAEVQKEGNRINSLRPARTVRSTGTGVGKTAERRVSRHKRTDSDHVISDVDQIPTGADAHVFSNSRPANPRADSALTTVSLVSTTTAGDKTQWKPGKGFRIVEESPLSSRGPTPAPSDDPAAFGMSWAAGDRYTLAPARHDTSRSTSPVKGFTAHGPSTPVRPHADVLPQSPPQITSPLLENSLCFTPPRPPRALMSPSTTPTNAKWPDTSRKLRSPKQPQLPLPRYGDGGINSPRPDMYRGRLAKSTKKSQRPPTTSQGSSSSTTYTRYGDGRATQAMQRVEDIVERSWGARDLGHEGVRALSPTGFGRSTGN
ncbi:hypothetical protein C0995_010561 [Termitomyces sp. Mi166|nr:hypothetical protein C0995_010561 [Termitomyces sp. Mi166\